MDSKKRKQSVSEDLPTKLHRPSSTIIGISRSISACQRCRSKKVRCDQNFPKCLKCEKAGVDCIGLDPATGREVPRSYVIHLEDRIAHLELKLQENGIDPDLTSSNKIIEPVNKEVEEATYQTAEQSETVKKNNLGNIVLQNGSYHHATSSSISFAELLVTALKINKKSNKHTEQDPSISLKNNDITPAILPPKQTALEFIKIYFSQSNSQLPILHREEFIRDCFIPIYGALDDKAVLASNYTAINYSVFNNKIKVEDTWFFQYKQKFKEILSETDDVAELSQNILPPKKFHKQLYFLNMIFAIASSVHHLQYPLTISDSFKSAAAKYEHIVFTSEDQLESLQGILLLALYSIMRPGVPGVWYVLGTALRVCVDIGLHNESSKEKINAFDTEKRRRLFWCSYSLDRQICFYLKRPVGIPDEAINTPYPSELDDALIVPSEMSNTDYSKDNGGMPSYKTISIAFIKIRQIQSEVQKVLYEKSELPRKYKNFLEWKKDINNKLKVWKFNAPKTSRKMNCDFNVVFFNLNYNHTVLVLHGVSPKNHKLSVEDFLKVCDSSKELINCYTLLHNTKSINYTWAAVHNLFMAGTAYLYTIYNSNVVREQNLLFEVKKITSECLLVLESLVDRCDAAANCRNIFENLTRVIIKLKYNENVHLNFSMKDISALNNENWNTNLKKLVENINESQQLGPSSDMNIKDLDPKPTTSGAERSKIDPNVLTFFNFKKGDEFIGSQSPSTFEWISNKDSYSLNNFFNELENLSPISTSPANGNSLGINLNSLNSDSPGSYESNISNTSPNENTKTSSEDKKVFDLIQNMPTESIWDQFFTIGPNIGMNGGLSLKKDFGDE